MASKHEVSVLSGGLRVAAGRPSRRELRIPPLRVFENALLTAEMRRLGALVAQPKD